MILVPSRKWYRLPYPAPWVKYGHLDSHVVHLCFMFQKARTVTSPPVACSHSEMWGSWEGLQFGAKEICVCQLSLRHQSHAIKNLLHLNGVWRKCLSQLRIFSDCLGWDQKNSHLPYPAFYQNRPDCGIALMNHTACGDKWKYIPTRACPAVPWRWLFKKSSASEGSALLCVWFWSVLWELMIWRDFVPGGHAVVLTRRKRKESLHQVLCTFL